MIQETQVTLPLRVLKMVAMVAEDGCHSAQGIEHALFSRIYWTLKPHLSEQLNGKESA